MKFIPGIFIIGFILAACLSCRSVKTIQTAITKKDTAQIVPVVDTRNDSLLFIHKVLDSVQRNHIEFLTFSSKAKVHYEGGDGDKNDFTAYIRLIKDSALWINKKRSRPNQVVTRPFCSYNFTGKNTQC